MIRRKSIRKILLCVAGFTLAATELPAQVTNNNISQRSELILDEEWLHSGTANNSVEWDCINKSLTNKCLVYHNDQWFHFAPPTNGKFFLNISSQECRNKEGVQVIIIEGNPCEVNTYRILACVPKIYQEDIFLELDSLKTNTQYLVNVDGFLGDFCEFDIQFSSKPKGFPQLSNALDTLNLRAELNEGIVYLHWNVNQQTARNIQHFEIFLKKKGEVKSVLKAKVRTQGNALGSFVEEYSVTDTLLSGGEFLYQIIAVERANEMRKIVSNRNIKFIPKVLLQKEIYAKVPLSFPYEGRIEVSIFNLKDGELLNYSIYDYRTPEMLSVPLTKFVQTGVQQFQIKLRHNKARENKLFDFQLNEDGEAVRIIK